MKEKNSCLKCKDLGTNKSSTGDVSSAQVTQLTDLETYSKEINYLLLQLGHTKLFPN